MLSCYGTHPERNQFYCTCLSHNFASCRSFENSVFMEDFSDMLLLKLLNISITAADDNEKVGYLVNKTFLVLPQCLVRGSVSM